MFKGKKLGENYKMKKRMIVVLMLLCFSFAIQDCVKAQNTRDLCFKSPFSLFADKDESKDGKKNKKEPGITEEQKVLKPKIVNDPKNKLGVLYAANAVDKVEFYIEEGDFASAQEALTDIEEWIYKATEFHTNLYKALSKVQNSEVQADVERDLAIQFAVLRDRALYLESKILTANGKNKEAVENLVEVVRSQPKTELGFKAYQALQELGFSYKFEYELIEEEPDKGIQKWF